MPPIITCCERLALRACKTIACTLGDWRLEIDRSPVSGKVGQTELFRLLKRTRAGLRENRNLVYE